MLRINWNHLKSVRDRLQRDHKLTDDSHIIFHPTPGSKSGPVRFGEFLEYFWQLYDNKIDISKVIVVDAKTSRVLYKHQPTMMATESKPSEGDGAQVLNWNKFPEEKKEALLEILLSQIESFDDE